ncbi:hypothetical protein Pan258_01810 [Symmachiella dynata]|uniref:hypothetical protein n=1 Tax=Symmachiella dynata TaxID=2527995 RepID=UPI00118BF7F1|nr:hypothetical protein [Symmachiella dynata]QDT46164.1 hypothetical protein Pan258_01810 [Symmachiella dynata]
MSENKALLKDRGRLWILDESASVKAFKEIAVVDNVQVSHPGNPVDVKTPSGITVFKSNDMGAQISLDLYHPGDAKSIERLFRGPVTRVEHDGATAVAGEEVVLNFRNANEALPIPGFNGAKTAATINSVKSLDGSVTYTLFTVSGDYKVLADTETGLTLIEHVGAGIIPLDTDVVVNYDYTPLKSQQIKPDDDAELVDRFLVIDSYPDCDDTTKYRRYFLPRMTVTSDLLHSLLEMGQDNQSPNIMPVTMTYNKPSSCSDEPRWYWIDTYNHLQ